MSRNPNLVKIPKKGSNTLLVFLLILFLAFVIGLGFFLSRGKKEEQKGIGGPQTNETSLTPAANEQEKEKKKEKAKKEEKKKEQKTTAYSGSYFSVNYPENWQAKKINGTTTSFYSGENQGLGDVTISYKENKKNLPIERFYDGINDINLFEDAAGGFEKTKVGNYEAFKFKDLVGETPSTVIVVKVANGFIEVSDNYNAHQTDGIFDEFVESLRVK